MDADLQAVADALVELADAELRVLEGAANEFILCAAGFLLAYGLIARQGFLAVVFAMAWPFTVCCATERRVTPTGSTPSPRLASARSARSEQRFRLLPGNSCVLRTGADRTGKMTVRDRRLSADLC